MQKHRRGRSLSDALTLEQSDGGALVVSSAVPNQGLKEGDEVLGATIDFEELSKDEVLHVLKLMEPFNDRIKVLTRNNRSKSVGNLAECGGNPEEMLKDSYNRLYNAKIKKFMKNDPEEETSLSGDVQASTKLNPKYDKGLPRLGVDFGLKTRTLGQGPDEGSQFDDHRELTYDTNLNLPPMGVGPNGTALVGAKTQTIGYDSAQLQTPDLQQPGTLSEYPKVTNGADGPSMNMAFPNVEGSVCENYSKGTFKAPELGIDMKGLHTSSPGIKVKLNGGPEDDMKTEVSLGNIGPKHSKKIKNPDLNLDDPSSYVKSPKVRLSKKLKSPDLDVDLANSGHLPEFGVSEKMETLKAPDLSLETPKPKIRNNQPKLASNTQSSDMKEPPVKYRAPEFKMPKFDLPEFQIPNFSEGYRTTDMQFKTPQLKAGINAPTLNLKGHKAPEIKGGIDAFDLDMPNMDLRAPKVDVNAPGVSIDSPKSKFKMPKLKLHKFSLPGLKGPDIDTNLDVPDMDVNTSEINLKVPNANVEMPDLDVGGRSGKLKMPNVNPGNLGLSGPKLDGQNLDLNTPNFDISGPRLEGGINEPDIDMPTTNLNGPKMDLHTPKLSLDRPSGKMKMPDLHSPDWDLKASLDKLKPPKLNVGGTLPKGPNLDLNTDLETPDLNLRAPQIKGGIDAPNIEMPNMEPKAPKLDVNAPGVSIDSPKSKFKMPKLNLPKFSLPGLKGPDIDGSLDVPDMNVNAPKLDLKGPKANVEMPDLDVGGLSGKLKKPSLNLGDMELSGLKLDGSNLDLQTPNFDISGPRLEGGINAPDINMPTADLKGPKMDLHTPKLSLDKPSGKIEMPDLHSPDWDLRASFDKLKHPKLNVGGTLPRGPNLEHNADVGTPDFNLRAPKIKGGIDAPDLDMPNMDLKVPKFDVNAPGVSIDSPKSKFKMPKLKLRKFSLPGLKGPDIDGSLDVPDMDVNAPNINLKGAKADFEMPDLDVGTPSGKFKMPNVSPGDLELSGPKVDGFNLKLKKPNFNVSGPHLDGGINAPDIDMPTVDLNGPKMDLQTPKLSLVRPSSNMKMPELNSPDWDLKASLDKLKPPKLNVGGTLPRRPNLDFNAGIESTDFNLKSPEIKGGIDTLNIDMPNMDLKAPKLDVNAPGVSIDSPKSKFKMPKLKLPKFSLPGLKGPDIDGSLDFPDMDVNAPSIDLKGPKANVEMPDLDVGGLSGKLKKPSLNFGDLELSGPKLDGSNLDLQTPNFDISGPRLEGGINAPDINMPTADLKGPKMDLHTPKLSLDKPSGKMKMPDLHSPDWDLKSSFDKLKPPKLNVGGTLPRGPNLDINADIGSPDFNLKTPKIKGGIDAPDIEIPNMDLEAPKFDLNAPGVSIGSPKGKFKMPKLKWPKFSLPGIKRPDIDGSLDVPDMDVNVPNVDLECPKVDVDMPDFDVGGQSGKLKMPNVNLGDLELSSPNLDGPKLKLKKPDFDVSGPHLDGGINAPDTDMPTIDLNGPKMDLHTPKFGLERPSGKIKMPDLHSPDWDLEASFDKLKHPKLNVGGTLPKGPNLDLNTDVGTPDLNLRAPKIKGGIDAPDIEMPNMDLKAPQLDVNAPGVSIDSPKSKFKMPKLNLPKFSLPGLKGPDIDGSLGVPDMDVNVPKLDLKGSKSNVEMPDLDVGGLSGNLHTPNFDISGPRFEGGINAPDINMPTADLSGPKIDLHAPKLNLDRPSGKMKMPDIHSPDWDLKASFDKLKPPKLNVNGTLPRGPNLDLNADVATPDLNLRAPKIKGGIDAPDLDMPNVDLKAPELNSPKSKFKIPKVKWPKFSLPGLKGPDIDGNLDGPNKNINSPNLNLTSPKAGLEIPDVDFPGPSVGFNTPNLNTNLPDLDSRDIDLGLKSPKLDVNVPDIKFGSPKMKMKFPKLNLPEVNLPNLKTPEVDGKLNSPDISIKASTTKVKGSKPGFQMPDVDFGGQSEKFQLPHLKMPGVGFSSPEVDTSSFNFPPPDISAKLPKEPNLNASDLRLKAPKLKTGINTPNFNVNNPNGNLDLFDVKMTKPVINTPKGPNVDINNDLQAIGLNAHDLSLSGPKVSMQDIDLPNKNLKSPKVDLTRTYADVGIDGNTALPQVKGEVRSPNFEVNAPFKNLLTPQTDLESVNKKMKLPSFKLPQLGSQDINRTGSDIDFGASLRPTSLDISPPNAKMYMKSPQLMGNMTGPNIIVPSVNRSIPKVVIPLQSPQKHVKNPDLNLDDAGMKIRSSYPVPSAALGHHVDFNRSDLNIDDFTGRDHVLRARGLRPELQTSHTHRKVIPQSRINVDMKDPRQSTRMPRGDIVIYSRPQKAVAPLSKQQTPRINLESKNRGPKSSGGYYVTVFPTDIQNQRVPSRKRNTLGGTEFQATNLDLEVPNAKNDTKGSTFYFSDLV